MYRWTTPLLLVLLSLPAAALAQSLAFSSLPANGVGAGLQYDNARVQLSNAQHGGVVVRVESADSTRALVAATKEAAGQPFVDVFVPNGGSHFTLSIKALEGASGWVPLLASAPGFTAATDSVEAVAPALRLLSVPTSFDTFDPDDSFYAQLGIARADSVTLAELQRARAGGPGVLLTFSSSDGAVAEIVTAGGSGQVAQVTVPAGDYNSPNSGAGAGGSALSAVGPGNTTISAGAPGFVATDLATAAVEVLAASMSFTGFPEQVGSGLVGNALRVRLSGNAHGGTMASIVSTDSSKVLFSADDDSVGQGQLEIFVPDGQVDAVFYAHVLEGETGLVTVEASAAGVADVAEVVQAVTPGLRLTSLGSSLDTLDPPDYFRVQVGVPNSLGSGLSELQEARPGGPGLDVLATSSNPLALAVANGDSSGSEAGARIEPGDFTTPASNAAGALFVDGIGAGSSTVVASIPGFTPTSSALQEVTVSQPTIARGSGWEDVGSGLQTGQARVQLGATAHGGVDVLVEVDDPSLALVSGSPDSVGTASQLIHVADGNATAGFYLQALEGQVGTLRISASAPGFTSLADSVEVVVPGLRILNLAASQDVFDPADAFRVQLGRPAGGGVSGQPLRAGSPGVDITVAVDDSTIAVLEQTAGTAGTALLPLAAGEELTPFTVATGGVALDGLQAGSVQVAASAPGFLTTPTGTLAVTLTTPSISFNFTTVEVGAGLQGGSYFANLGASQHGGTEVTITVDDPSLVLVSGQGHVVGDGSLVVQLANGDTAVPFHIQALDGQLGPATLTASAPGHTSDLATVEVVQPGVEIQFLDLTQEVGGPTDDFRARVGIPNSGATGLQQLQPRRAGAPPLVVGFASSNPAVGELLTLAGTGATAEASLPAGESYSPASVLAGGVAFRPLDSGSTLVSADIAGFLQVGNAIREVVVSNTGIAFPGVPVALGQGLQVGPLLARLASSTHGGVTLTLASADSNDLLVAPDGSTPGSLSMQVFVPNGTRTVEYWLQGKPAGTGTVELQGTAPGFDPGSVSTSVEPAALQVAQLADSLDVGAFEDAFLVQVGVASAGGDSLAQLQALRAGAAPLQALVSVDDPAVARLLGPGGSTGGSLVVEIPAGSSQSAATTAAGGVALDPLSPGPVLVTAAIPDLVPTGAAAHPVLITGTLTGTGDTPLVLRLDQNSPNPFNPRTTIRFQLPAAGPVRLQLFDLRGREVARLWDGELPAGPHEMRWDGRGGDGRPVASGVYVYRLETPSGALSRKLTLLQ